MFRKIEQLLLGGGENSSASNSPVERSPFASPQELKTAGLLSSTSGVLLGRQPGSWGFQPSYLRDSNHGNVCWVMPPRTGKTNMMIAAALDAANQGTSMVFYDLKACEITSVTSRYRMLCGPAVVFDPYLEQPRVLLAAAGISPDEIPEIQQAIFRANCAFAEQVQAHPAARAEALQERARQLQQLFQGLLPNELPDPLQPHFEQLLALPPVRLNLLSVLKPTDPKFFELVNVVVGATVAQPKFDSNPHWITRAQSIWRTILLYTTCEMPKEYAHMAQAWAIFNDFRLQNERWQQHWLPQMLASPALDGTIALRAAELSEIPELELKSILSTLTNQLELFGNPFLRWAISNADFDIATLKQTPGSTLYIVIPSEVVRVSNRLLRSVFVSLLVGLQQTATKGPHTLLFIDEFAQLDNMSSSILDTLAIAPGAAGIRTIIALQSLAQLQSAYPNQEWQTVLSLFHTLVFGGVASKFDSDFVSGMLGKQWQKMADSSRSTQAWDAGSFVSPTGNYSESERWNQLPVLEPHQIRELNQKYLVFARGSRPCIAEPIQYWKERSFRGRYLSNPLYPASKS